MRLASAQLTEGKRPEKVLKSSRLFPCSFLQLLTADQMAAYLTGIYESDLEYRLERALAMLDPMIILILGSAVGAVLVGVLLPMTQLLTVL